MLDLVPHRQIQRVEAADAFRMSLIRFVDLVLVATHRDGGRLAETSV